MGALVRLPFPSPLETFPDLSLAPLLLPSGGLPRSPTRASLPTTLVRGRFLVLSPLETSPDLSLDPLPLLSGGLPRLLTRVSLPTTLARGKQQCTPLVSPLLPANYPFCNLLLPPAASCCLPTTPSATSPPSCPSDTSTLLASLLVSVLLSVLDTPTAKH